MVTLFLIIGIVIFLPLIAAIIDEIVAWVIRKRNNFN